MNKDKLRTIGFILPVLFVLLTVFLFLAPSNSNAAFGTELFLHMDRTSAEVGQIISGEVTARIYKKSTGETVVIPKVIFGDGTSLVLGKCVADPDTPHDYIYCAFTFIHVYDNPQEYNLTTSAFVDAHSNVPGPGKTITIAEKATSSLATRFQPALVATSTAEIIQKIVGVISWIIGSLLVLLIMIGGFTIMTATGNPEKIGKGKHIIVYAIIGFAIMVISKGILELIYLILGIDIP